MQLAASGAPGTQTTDGPGHWWVFVRSTNQGPGATSVSCALPRRKVASVRPPARLKAVVMHTMHACTRRSHWPLCVFCAAARAPSKNRTAPSSTSMHGHSAHTARSESCEAIPRNASPRAGSMAWHHGAGRTCPACPDAPEPRALRSIHSLAGLGSLRARTLHWRCKDCAIVARAARAARTRTNRKLTVVTVPGASAAVVVVRVGLGVGRVPRVLVRGGFVSCRHCARQQMDTTGGGEGEGGGG